MEDTQKTDEQIKAISQYIADDLKDVRFYVVDEVATKIKAALNILIHKKFESEFVLGLKNKTNRLLHVTKRNEIELKFWKDIARKYLNESDMNLAYREIDSILIEKELK